MGNWGYQENFCCETSWNYMGLKRNAAPLYTLHQVHMFQLLSAHAILSGRGIFIYFIIYVSAVVFSERAGYIYPSETPQKIDKA